MFKRKDRIKVDEGTIKRFQDEGKSPDVDFRFARAVTIPDEFRTPEQFYNSVRYAAVRGASCFKRAATGFCSGINPVDAERQKVLEAVVRLGIEENLSSAETFIGSIQDSPICYGTHQYFQISPVTNSSETRYRVSFTDQTPKPAPASSMDG